MLYVWEVEGDGNAGDGVGAQFLMRPHGHASAGVSGCLVREQLLLRVETGRPANKVLTFLWKRRPSAASVSVAKAGSC